MPDLTVVWADAVPFEAAYGQQQNGADGKGAVAFDAAAMAGGFVIRPMFDSSVESAMAGAVPYVSATDDVVEDSVPKRGRPKKED